MTKTALISVYNKTDIVPLAKFLLTKNINIVSTGGTYRLLKQNIDSPNIKQISTLTKFPEILNGRVKTLHPKIHGAILAKRNETSHQEELIKHNIQSIDYIIVNLYPFSKTIKQPNVTEDTVLENIDIGGHTLIRAGCKNYQDVLVITDPQDYSNIINNFDNLNHKEYAIKGFQHVTKYDMAISNYFSEDIIFRGYKKISQLKYGSNPQQTQAAIYQNVEQSSLPFKVLNGNPGYINYLDAIYSWNLVHELSQSLNIPSCASFKHTSPAGVSIAQPLTSLLKKIYLTNPNIKLTPLATAFIRARNVDPMSSYGDFIALSNEVDECTAKLIKIEVSDGIIAPGYTDNALKILKQKKRGNYVILQANPSHKYHNTSELREFHNITLVQDENIKTTRRKSLKNIVTTSNKTFSQEASLDLIVANTALKYTQSNSVASAFNGQVIGVGAGQQSRIDCVKLVKRKTENWYLRQHPKCIKLITYFKPKTKRSYKINAIIRYIEDDFTQEEYKQWLNLFTTQPEKLTHEDKKEFLKTLDNISLASDAFFPFCDNIDVSSQFGVRNIIQPGGSIADKDIINACNNYKINMCFTGRNMRMFLH